MKRIITVLFLLISIGTVFAGERHNKKFNEGVRICNQIAKDYNIDVEIKKVSALPNNAAAVTMKKGDRYIIKLDWNYMESMHPNVILPTMIHEIAHAIEGCNGHNSDWVYAIYEVVDYFDLNKYEANILSEEVEHR